MRIVIVGDGKVGFSLAEQLSREGHDIVVIDSNPKVLEEMLVTLDVMVVNGNGASLEIQKQASVGTSDILIAATSADEINLLSCVLAKKLGCKSTIARVRNRDYVQQVAFLRDELGLSMTINPERSAANEIFRMIQFPSFLKRDSFAKGRVELVEIKLDEDSVLVGTRLDELEKVLKMKLLICAVERGESITIPNGRFVFEAGDRITVTAPRSDIAKLIKKLDIAKHKIKNVMIIGGSRVALYLAEELVKSNVSVKIIEQDPDRCSELAEWLGSSVIIINGDGTRQDLLLEEGIKNTDAVISLTNIDEENLIISMYADYLKVPKTITKINRNEYSVLFGSKGIGSIISPKQITSTEIIRYVRAMENSGETAVRALHRIVDEKAEALEFLAVSTTKGLNIPLSQLSIKNNVLIACLSRDGRIIIPNGSDMICENDTVIVVTTSDRAIKDLNDIYENEE